MFWLTQTLCYVSKLPYIRGGKRTRNTRTVCVGLYAGLDTNGRIPNKRGMLEDGEGVRDASFGQETNATSVPDSATGIEIDLMGKRTTCLGISEILDACFLCNC